MKKTGVVVGRTDTNFCDLYATAEKVYILGLWCADGYHRTSSIGLSNTDVYLISAFHQFFLKLFNKNRLRLRVYTNPIFYDKSFGENLAKHLGIEKLSQLYLKKSVLPTIHLYVNSRPLLRTFVRARKNINMLPRENIKAYFAGRFDGDGSIAKDLRSDCRIVYTNKTEASMDQKLLRKIGIVQTNIYEYTQAHTYCLYVFRNQSKQFVNLIQEYSRTQKLVSVPSRDFSDIASER
ncbi:MAG: LAGLIDADG family homing endonuclease [Candidatus Zambryskibacteria bacterium]|nr:LAGLIDADG family homing endonuclease [Candidatus Zambryskibacteria bacterium]